MKVKVSFDFKAIQSFLVAHVEKFAFALVALCLLFFLSGAMRRTGYERTPAELVNIAEQADQHIEQTPPPEVQYEGHPVSTKATGIRTPIKPDFYDLPRLWTPFLWEQRAKRGEPKLYTVEALRGTAGHGAVRVRPSETNPLLTRSVIGQRWVVLTGLIPYEKEFDAYTEAFKDAEYRDSGRDTPKIIYYRVERAEIASPGDAVQPQWTQLNLRARLTEVAELWNGTLPEVVNSKYIHQGGVTSIVFPLPPLDGKTFGREVVHDPEIPLAAEEVPEEPAAEPAADVEDVDNPPVTDVPIDLPPEGRLEEAAPELVKAEPVPYRLFRFFDFDVEPGKHYRYRVKLLLANPNYDLDLQYLAQDSLRLGQWRETEWSEPTDVVSVPRDARVLLGSVKPSPGGRVTREPKATVGIPYFFAEAGAELYDRYEVARGKQLDFPDHELPPDVVPAGYGQPDAWLAAAAVGTKGKPEEPEPPKVDCNTETVLLDMIGGERLPGGDRDLTRPGHLLLLDPDGNLVVKNELDDKEEFDAFEAIKAAAEGKPGVGRPTTEDLFGEGDDDDDDDDDDDEY